MEIIIIPIKYILQKRAGCLLFKKVQINNQITNQTASIKSDISNQKDVFKCESFFCIEYSSWLRNNTKALPVNIVMWFRLFQLSTDEL